METYQKEFIEFLVRAGVLRFGEFRLKSGRISPYFFNAGQFNRAADIERLGYFYACAIRALDRAPTVVFGPAYKGIPLCIAAVIALRQHFGVDVSYCFDRKEVKGHGEGGWLVGRVPEQGDRLVLVDDVVTDGATKKEIVARLREASPAEVSGLVISLNRGEKGPCGEDPVAALAAETGLEVRAILSVHDILNYLPGRRIDGQEVLTDDLRKRMEAYLKHYGVGR